VVLNARLLGVNSFFGPGVESSEVDEEDEFLEAGKGSCK
jgi:hypothetical protein